MKTGSGTKPYDLYRATTRVPTSPAVNPMLYRLNPMWALKSCAAAGARTNPMTRLVTTASGRLSASGMLVLNRTSEKIGASARPKNAVLMCVANASPLNREYSRTPITMNQTFRRFFPNSAKPRTRNRHATAAPVIFAPAL